MFVEFPTRWPLGSLGARARGTRLEAAVASGRVATLDVGAVVAARLKAGKFKEKLRFRFHFVNGNML